MADTDALKKFDFGEVSQGGVFLKFESGKPIKLRILTVDPVLSVDSKFGSTRFGFVVWNFTAGKAQILNASPGVSKRIQEIHFDEDFGANIRKVDLKITAKGELLERKYTIDVLPGEAKDLTPAQIQEASAIKLEETIAKNSGFTKRLSMYNKEEYNAKRKEFSPDGDGDEPDRDSTDVGDQDSGEEDPLAGAEEVQDIDNIPF